MAGMIRTTNPYGFRSGKWAKLRGTILAPERDGTGRLCYIVEFGDEVIDFWVIRDHDGMYEFA